MAQHDVAQDEDVTPLGDAVQLEDEVPLEDVVRLEDLAQPEVHFEDVALHSKPLALR